MKRKLFFIRLLCFGFTVVFAECFCSCTKQEKTLRFAIASDFHAPDVPDGEKRVASFIKAAKTRRLILLSNWEISAGWIVQVRSIGNFGIASKRINIMLLVTMTWINIPRKNMLEV